MQKTVKKLFVVFSSALFCSVTGSSIAGEMTTSGFVRAGGAINTGDTPYLERGWVERR